MSPNVINKERREMVLYEGATFSNLLIKLRKQDFGSHSNNLLQPVPMNIVPYTSFILRSLPHES